MSDRHQFRAQWHDYNRGTYFVTICCADKKHYFGEIRNGKMELSAVGIIAVSQIQNLSKFFADTEIWNYVVMPNHVHLVIAIGRSTHGKVKTGNTTNECAANDNATNDNATNGSATNAGMINAGMTNIGDGK